MPESKFTTPKILINSLGVLLVSILASFVLQFVAALLLGPLFFYFNFIPFVIGPLVLIIFIIRGVRLFLKTRSIKLVALAVVAPLIIVPSLIMFLTYRYQISNDLPINIFAPQVNWVTQKVQEAQFEDSLKKLIAGTEVNPTEICLIRKSYGDTGLVGHAGSAWMYIWAIEWRGAMKFPQGDILGIFGIITNDTTDNGTTGIPYIENADGVYALPNPDYWHNPAFSSDGTFHAWQVDFGTPLDGEHIIKLFYTNEAATNFQETLAGKYYAVTVPEIILQKMQSLAATENTSGYRLNEYYPQQLTKAEQLMGTVCAPLNTPATK